LRSVILAGIELFISFIGLRNTNTIMSNSGITAAFVDFASFEIETKQINHDLHVCACNYWVMYMLQD
jgi:hypothetical protein